MGKIIKQIGESIGSYWAAVAATFLGGLGGIWWLSERAQDGVEFVVVKSSAGGIALNGDYRINLWVLFFNFLIIFLVSMACVALGRELMKAHPEIQELGRLKVTYNDILNCARRITATNLYPGSDGRPRININKMHVSHIVEKDGSTEIVRTYDVSCPNEPAHAFEVSMQADDESDPVQTYRGIDFRVQDLVTKRELSWIPTSDALREKEFAIYFSEMKKGDSKSITIRYRWPGYMKRVLEKGSTEFWWSHKAATENATSNVTYEWIYKPGFPQVTMTLVGVHSASANLNLTSHPEGVRWLYTDQKSVVDKRDYKISIEAIAYAGA